MPVKTKLFVHYLSARCPRLVRRVVRDPVIRVNAVNAGVTRISGRFQVNFSKKLSCDRVRLFGS